MFERLVDLFPLSEVRKQVLGQTAVQILGKAVTVLGTFLVVRMISSHEGLGKFGYGQFVLISTYVGYFYLLLDFGLNTIYVQWVTNQPDQERPLLAQLLSLRLVLSAAMILLALIILAFLPSDPYSVSIKVGIIFALATIALQSLFMTGNAYFQLKLSYQVSVAVVSAASLFNLAATYTVLRLGFGLPGVLLAYVLEFAVLGLGALLMLRRYLVLSWLARWSVWRDYITAAAPLGLSIFLTLLYFQSDTFLLSVLRLDPSLGMNNTTAPALYNLPYSMFVVFLTVPTFLMNATYPLMLKAFKRNVNDLSSLVVKTIGLSLAIALVMTLGTWLLAPLAIHLQTNFNADFEPSILVLRILAVGLPIFFTTNVLMFTLITLEYKNWLPIVYGLAGVVNISLNLWLLPRYGITAAAINTVLTELVIFLLLGALTWSAYGRARQMEASVGA